MPDNLGRVDDDVRTAVRYAALVAVIGIGFLAAAALLTGDCPAPGESVEATVRCAVPVRLTFAAVGPVILFGGAVGAFVRTYRLWRAERTWWGWQGAGWFLLTVTLLVATIGLPLLAGTG